MTIPHYFPSLIEGPAQAVLVVGAGLSYPDLQMVEGLVKKLESTARSMGIAIDCMPDHEDYFYVLAEAVLTTYSISNHKSQSESRLWLAELFGILNDRRWFGEIGLRLSGSTPRHRAIARFAVEQRLQAIVSLNWDTLLEAALESVGLVEGDRPPRPWDIVSYIRVIHDAHLPTLANSHVFPVIKPHGCVRDLIKVKREYQSTGHLSHVTFKVTKADVDAFSPDQVNVDREVQSHVAKCPLIAVGWKAAEGYLRKSVISIAQSVQHAESDAFTLVSRSWYPNEKRNETYHDDIAAAYGRNKTNSFIAVDKAGPLTPDHLFQWLQARYALNKLIGASAPSQRVAMQQLLQQIDLPECKHPILEWADHWLPLWVRLCWRFGLMHGCDPHTGQQIEPHMIPITPRDVHVPLGGMCIHRDDLQTAAKLLIRLGNALSCYNYKKFPGGLWNSYTGCLYLPLPSLHGATRPGDLMALKSLLVDQHSLGFVKSIYLVWLASDDLPPSQMERDQLAAQVSALMPLAKFAVPEALAWVELDALHGGTHDTCS